MRGRFCVRAPWVRGRDIVALLSILRHQLDASGSLEQCFLDGDDGASPDIGTALESFGARARRWTCGGVRQPRRTTRRARVLPAASGGSACKRLTCFSGGWCAVTPSTSASGRACHRARLVVRSTCT